MLEKVKDTILAHHLIRQKDKIVVAISGGPDSVALIHILKKLHHPLGLSIIAAHLNHNLRGRESDQDAEFVKKLCKTWNLPLFSEKLKNKPRNENEARESRYQFLEKVRAKNKAQMIATAHNADDQAETILLHLLRGAGLAGLAGISYRNHKLIRPLLDCDRQEIEIYLRKNKLASRLDQTNLNTKILRNKVRMRLLPLLAREYNPQIKKNVINLGQIADYAQSYLEEAAQKFLRSQTTDISLKAWRDLPPILKREVLRQALKQKKGDLQNIYAVHIEELVQILERPEGNKKKDLPGGLRIIKKNGRISIASSEKMIK